MQEEDIDIGMGRQIAPAVATDRHQREAARRGRIGLRIDDMRCTLQQHPQQLVDQGRLGCNDFGAGGPSIELLAELPAAIVAGAPRQLQNALPVISIEPG